MEKYKGLEDEKVLSSAIKFIDNKVIKSISVAVLTAVTLVLSACGSEENGDLANTRYPKTLTAEPVDAGVPDVVQFEDTPVDQWYADIDIGRIAEPGEIDDGNEIYDPRDAGSGAVDAGMDGNAGSN